MNKKITKAKPKKKAAPVQAKKTFTVSANFTHDQEIQVRKFLGMQNMVIGVLGTMPPPNNPYDAISYRDGYHWRCIHHLVNATVGQGYEASDNLREHIDDINLDYKLEELLQRCAFDFFVQGWHTVHVLKGNNTANVWHSPAIKTRLKVNRQTLARSFVRFEYEPMLGWLSYVEEPEFTSLTTSGVRQMNNLSRSGNRYYGDPDYVNIKSILLLNWSVVEAASRWFEHGLMSDLAIIESGMGREDDEIQEVKEYLGKHLKGVENSHKIIYMQVAPDEKVEFKTLSSDFPGVESMALKNANRDEIIVAHGLYPRLVGVATAGALGGMNEVQSQLGAFKKLVADPMQRKIERWWQKLFLDLGFPESNSFKLKAINIDNQKDTMDTLNEGVTSQIIPLQTAQEEWAAEKSMKNMVGFMRRIRKELIA